MDYKLIAIMTLLCGVFSANAQISLDESNLPIVIIETGSEIVDEPKVVGTMKIINNTSGTNRVNDPVNGYNGNIGIELRGASSQSKFPKKNFAIELKTREAIDSSASILGMPEEEDWILHGPYSDKALIRNVLTFHLWSQMGRYGSNTRLVELMLNDEYVGVYVAMEKIKRDKNRVDISKLNPEENSGDDLTGGYIIKIDKLSGTNSGVSWTSKYLPSATATNEQAIDFQIEYPKSREISLEQELYIRNHVTEFEQKLNSPNFKDSLDGYRSVVNIESFIDYSIINELSKDVDGYRISSFLHKDKDSKGGKLVMGPIWDFNITYGNAESCGYNRPDGWGWRFNEVCGGTSLNPFWWNRFMQDELYVEGFRNRWTELRKGPFQDTTIINFIDSVALVLEEPARRNFERWPILDIYIWPNTFVGTGNYQEEIDFLKKWILDRLSWLDKNVQKLQTLPIADSVPELNEPNPSLLLFPNPTRSELNIQSTEIIETIEVMTLSGTHVMQKNNIYSANTVLDVSSLSKGTYIISLIQIDDGIINGVFIKD